MLFHVLIIFLFKMSCLEILYQNFYSGVSSLFILAIKVLGPRSSILCFLVQNFGISIEYLLKYLTKSIQVTQSCLTPCDPMDCSPPGSSVHQIPQARTLEWVTISFSRGSS